MHTKLNLTKNLLKKFGIIPFDFHFLLVVVVVFNLPAIKAADMSDENLWMHRCFINMKFQLLWHVLNAKNTQCFLETFKKAGSCEKYTKENLMWVKILCN